MSDKRPQRDWFAIWDDFRNLLAAKPRRSVEQGSRPRGSSRYFSLISVELLVKVRADCRVSGRYLSRPLQDRPQPRTRRLRSGVRRIHGLVRFSDSGRSNAERPSFVVAETLNNFARQSTRLIECGAAGTRDVATVSSVRLFRQPDLFTQRCDTGVACKKCKFR